MLSRSSSNAGDRLRRAKSTSSTHTTSSGSRPTQQSSDPFVTRQQAEAAAIEAYNRAQQQPGPVYQEYRAVPPRLERRRSRASGRTEGGHFEEARLGRRKSNSKRDDNAASKPPRVRPQQPSEVTNESHEEERVITRKRSVIPPNSSTTYQYNYSLPSSANRHLRKAQSGYSDGSPVPRNISTIKERRSTLQLSTPRLDQSEICSSSASRRPYHSDAVNTSRPLSKTPKDSPRQMQSSQGAVAQARDRCLQDFQQKKLRERKSFILGPFQKRKSSSVLRSRESGYDTALPPFNYADEDVPLPPPPPPEIPVPTISVPTEKKSRNFSESLKGRFKKVFRRSSRAPSGIPAQHVEGSHFYFPSSSPLSTPGVRTEKVEDPFTAAYGHTHLAVPDTNPDTATGRYSAAGESTTKSRVTSWTNSTVPGTWSTRPDIDDSQESADEHGRLKRTDSVSTLRKASSFFGRPIKNKLRKASKAELRSSEESSGLFSALQERIHSSRPESETPQKGETTQASTSSAIATLPSQQREHADSSVSSKSRWQAPTIRSVTPDAAGSNSDPLSPVTEVQSPEIATQIFNRQSTTDEEQPNSTPRSQLQRRPAMKAPTPSKEQIARRIERSKNRWQSPLDELSPSAPRANRAAMEENPYELRSLSRTLHQPVLQNDLPHHAKINEQSTEERDNVFSPSLYSRGTDGASPRPDTPVDQGGTMITITGHEVRSYSISPKKAEPPVARPVRHSQEWRRWLSNEMSGWNSMTEAQDLTLAEAVLKTPGSDAIQNSNDSEQSGPNTTEKRADSTSPALEVTPLEPKAQRRKAKSRRPSYMNDRYPMIDTGRNSSSEKTVKHSSRISTRTGSRPGTAGSVEPASGNSVVKSRPGSVMTTGRIISKPQSITHLRPEDRTKSADESREVEDEGNAPSKQSDGVEKAVNEATKISSRPKSAFDLRANYKNSANGRAKAIAVRRKTENNDNILILEDTTIQKISAGPYASQVPVAAPPDANKENTPSSEATSLPALSSSEWLAAGTNKKRDTRKASAIYPAQRSVSRYSPPRATNCGAGGGDRSPGQRLVTNWLDGKKSKENSPVFV